MREKIIFAPGPNENEFRKSLSMNGINNIGMKIISAPELARLALMKSGVPVTEKIITKKEEMVLIAEAVKDTDYFGEVSYADISNIRSAVSALRNLSDVQDDITEKLSEGTFEKKNQALISVLENYTQALNKNNYADGISFVIKAIDKAEKMDQELICLDEFPLSPLERKLAEKLSGGKYDTVNISALYNKNIKTPDSNKVTFKNCYGSANEVENILDSIYRGDSPDSCTVAVTDISVYSQLFFDYSVEHNIPVTFGCGIPVSNSNPAALLNLYNSWTTDGFFGTESLKKMISDSSFDHFKFVKELPETELPSWITFVEILGNLRITNNESINRERIESFKNSVAEEKETLGDRYEKSVEEKLSLLPAIEAAAKEFTLPAEEFISKYAYIRKGNTYADSLIMKLDMAALSSLCSEIKTVRLSGKLLSDVINDLMKKNVCRQSSSEGAVHLTDINGAFSVVRPNLYIAGMSSANYPGSPVENYLLLDSDFELFSEKCQTSDGKVMQKIKSFQSLINLYAALDCKINISYPGMNVSDLKKCNASSVIYDLFRKIFGDSISWEEMNSKIEKSQYFDPAVSVSREIGKAYNAEKIIELEKCDNNVSGETVSADFLLDKVYSPSALDKFFECPRKFMFNYVLNLYEPDFYNIFEVISAADKGTLAHQLMEVLADKPTMSLETFRDISVRHFKSYLGQKTVVIADAAYNAMIEFVEMMEKAFISDQRNKVIFHEIKIEGENINGIKIAGYPDRVEEADDGKCIIVDYKTGSKIKHVKDDINTCLQVVIYAYILEQQGYQIKECQFRYINANETVSCRYDENMKAELDEKIEDFKKHLKDMDFPKCSDEDTCKYCGYKNMCEKKA